MNKIILLLFLSCSFPALGNLKISEAESVANLKNGFTLEELSLRDLAAKKPSKKATLKRSKSTLPKLKSLVRKRKKSISLKEVKPPSGHKMHYPKGTDEAELESIINEEIQHIFKLLKKNRNADLTLRLGSLYVEKAKIITFKLQMDYEKKMIEFEQGSRTAKPRLDLEMAESYNRKALKLFQSFKNRYPRHSRLDEVLFFLGFNSYRLSQFEKGANYFRELETRFPKSTYLYESWFQLGEHYFKKGKWSSSYKYYSKVSRNKNGKFYFFALYKMAWCEYKRYRVNQGLNLLEKIIVESKKSRSLVAERFTFSSEAIQDLVLFYTYSKKPPENAKPFFIRLLGEEKGWASLKKLADAYRDTGNIKGVIALFGNLIDNNPIGPDAFNYKLEVALVVYEFGKVSEVVSQFEEWIKNYGIGSPWAKSNFQDKKLIEKSVNLIEVTLRNYALKNHQSYRTSKKLREKEIALNFYKMYFSEFKKSKHISQMLFFYGELLFDSKRYSEAVRAYENVIRKYPKSKYIQPAYLNQLLALEKSLPSQEEIEKIVGKTKTKVEIPEKIKSFIKISSRYLNKFPNQKNAPTVLYRMGILYYGFNQYEQASKYLKELSQKYPKFEHIGNVGGLLLDIYNKGKNYEELTKLATQFASNKEVDQELISEAKFVLEQISFKKAQDLAVLKKFKESADLYYKFAQSNASGVLAPVAYYNAGINYEKVKNIKKAISMYALVVTYSSKKHAKIRQKSYEFLPVLKEKMAFYKEAADGYAFYARTYPTSPKSIDYWYNAGIIYDALNEVGSAVFSYNKYFSLNKNEERYEALYLMGYLYEQNKNWYKAIQFYKQYLAGKSSKRLNQVKASFKVSSIYQNKLKNAAQALAWHKKTLALQKSLAVGISYGARSHFYIVERIYKRFLSVKIPIQANLQKAAVERKIKLLKDLERNLRPIIRYNEAEQIIASLALIGKANQKMAEAIYKTPIPKGLDPKGMQQYKAGILKIIDPYVKESIKSYELALSKTQKFKVYSEWQLPIYEGLGSMKMKEGVFQKFINPPVVPEVFKLQVFDSADVINKKLLGELTASLEHGVSKESLASIHKAIVFKKESQLLESVSKVLNKNPNNTLVMSTLAYFYIKNQKMKLASFILKRLISNGKKTSAVFNNLGVISLKYGNSRDAMTHFKKSVSLDPSYLIGKANLATLFVKNYDYESAYFLYKSCYSDLIQKWSIKNSKSVSVLNNYGISLAGINKSKTAMSLFKRFVKEPSPDPKILLNYAIVLVNGFEDKTILDEAKGLVDELSLYSKDPIFKQKSNQILKRIESRI